ncbi:MAG: putative immunity protein [Christensenellales bacterium]
MPEAEGAPRFPEVGDKLARRRALLFDPGSPCLQALLLALAAQDRLGQVIWALSCAEDPAAALSLSYPLDPRPAEALRLAWRWARGAAKMPEARRAILSVHRMAREVTRPADAALCHAVGQACSAVHTPRHARGLIFYGLTALVRQQLPDYEGALEAGIDRYLQRLHQLAAAPRLGPWAAFLLRGQERAQ